MLRGGNLASTLKPDLVNTSVGKCLFYIIHYLYLCSGNLIDTVPP